MRYLVNKYGGRTYCGNANCETLEECFKFADDGFCDKMEIADTESGKKYIIKIEGGEI